MKRTVLTAVVASAVALTSQAEVFISTHPKDNPNNRTIEVCQDICPEEYQLHPAVDLLSIDYSKINPDNPKMEKIEIEVPLNETFSYSAPVANSTGDWWSSKYNDKFLKAQTSMTYNNLEKLKTGAPGSDDGVKTETYRATKKGKYKIEIAHVHKSKMVYFVNILVKVI